MEYSNQELLRITDGDKCCHKNGFKNFRPRTTQISGPLLGTTLPTRVHVVVSEDFFFFCHGMQNLSSETGDRSRAPCSGSPESQLLDHQESPWRYFWLAQFGGC